MGALQQVFLRLYKEYSLVVDLEALDNLLLGQACGLHQRLLAVNIDLVVLVVLRIVKILGLVFHFGER